MRLRPSLESLVARFRPLAVTLVVALVSACGEVGTPDLPSEPILPPGTMIVTRIPVAAGRGHELRLAREAAPERFARSITIPALDGGPWPDTCDRLAAAGVTEAFLANSPLGSAIVLRGAEGIDPATLGRAFSGNASESSAVALGRGWYRLVSPPLTGPFVATEGQVALERAILESGSIDPGSAVVTTVVLPPQVDPDAELLAVFGDELRSLRLMAFSLDAATGSVTTGLRFDSEGDAESFRQDVAAALPARALALRQILGARPMVRQGAWCLGGETAEGRSPEESASLPPPRLPFAAHGRVAIHLRIDRDIMELAPSQLETLAYLFWAPAPYWHRPAFLGMAESQKTIIHLGVLARALGEVGIRELWATRDADSGFEYSYFFPNPGGASVDAIEEAAIRGTGRSDWIVKEVADGWIHLGFRDRSRQIRIRPEVETALLAGMPDGEDDDLAILEARPFVELKGGNAGGNRLERRRAALAAAAAPCLLAEVRHAVHEGPTRLDLHFGSPAEADAFLRAITEVAADLKLSPDLEIDDYLQHSLFYPLVDGTKPTVRGARVTVPLQPSAREAGQPYRSRDWVNPYASPW